MSLVSIKGVVDRVTFHNRDTGFCVLQLKVSGYKNCVTVVGTLAEVLPGEDAKVSGYWVQSKDYGLQLKAETIDVTTPFSVEGIKKVLSSGLIKGIGPYFASRLVDTFGLDVFTVIENEPHRLSELEGFGKKRIALLTEQWASQKIIRSIMVFLRSHGVSSSRAVRIYKAYGQRAIEKVRENPYQLAKDIPGIGFKSADLIARNLGIEKDSLYRAKAGIEHLLLEQTQQGHCAYSAHQLSLDAEKMLEIPYATLKIALEELLREKNIVFETIENEPCIYLHYMYQTEVDLSFILKDLMNALSVKKNIWDPKILESFQKANAITLSPQQSEAVQKALESKISIITGGPGTGKSTLTKAIVHFLQGYQMRVALCCPTGRAAKRLTECTGQEAKTIHRILKFDPKKGGFFYNAQNLLELDVLLIDEASMLDIRLAWQLLRAVPKHAIVIFIGDRDQLPSVGPGKFLEDLIHCGMFPCTILTEIYRQTKASQIITIAHQINQGNVPNLKFEKNSDFYFIQEDLPEKVIEKMISLIVKRIPDAFGYDPLNHIQILCPMQKGTLGARHLNQVIQNALNPTPSVSVQAYGIKFGVNDRVMIMENDYEKEVFNGDLGVIVSIDHDNQECTIQIDDRQVSFDFNELDIVTLAYTITVHKAQGSEFPVVIIPLSTAHFILLKRNLLYTAVTRGKKLVICIGQKKAFYLAIKNFKNQPRWTNLQNRLKLFRLNV